MVMPTGQGMNTSEHINIAYEALFFVRIIPSFTAKDGQSRIKTLSIRVRIFTVKNTDQPITLISSERID